MNLAWVVLLLAACGGGGGFPTDAAPEPPPPGARFSLSWTLADTEGQPITCAQVGANFVAVTLRNRDVMGGNIEVLGCSSGSATSLLTFTPGIYDISFELTGAVGRLAQAPAVTGIELKSGETAELPPIAFTVDATGKLELVLDTGITGGNCAGGAGVDNFTITLQHTGGDCEPVTFDIAPGTPTSYTVNCATPVLSTCIDTTQKLSVPSLPSGSYRLDVKGKIGGVDCFTNTATIVVPPLSQTLNHTVNLTQQTTAGC